MGHDFLCETLDRFQYLILLDAEIDVHDKAINPSFCIGGELVDHFGWFAYGEVLSGLFDSHVARQRFDHTTFDYAWPGEDVVEATVIIVRQLDLSLAIDIAVRQESDPRQ